MGPAVLELSIAFRAQELDPEGVICGYRDGYLLRVPIALLKDPGSVPSNHNV